jgi:hypothetical protein
MPAELAVLPAELQTFKSMALVQFWTLFTAVIGKALSLECSVQCGAAGWL